MAGTVPGFWSITIVSPQSVGVQSVHTTFFFFMCIMFQGNKATQSRLWGDGGSWAIFIGSMQWRTDCFLLYKWDPIDPIYVTVTLITFHFALDHEKLSMEWIQLRNNYIII